MCSLDLSVLINPLKGARLEGGNFISTDKIIKIYNSISKTIATVISLGYKHKIRLSYMNDVINKDSYKPSSSAKAVAIDKMFVYHKKQLIRPV